MGNWAWGIGNGALGMENWALASKSQRLTKLINYLTIQFYMVPMPPIEGLKTKEDKADNYQFLILNSKLSNAQCPMPNAQCPIPHAAFYQIYRVYPGKC